MDISYEENKELFDKYILECRKKIKTLLFSKDEIGKGLVIRDKYKQKTGIKISVDESIKKHRESLIDLKLNHTMRLVKSVTLIAEKIGANVDFGNVLKVSALLHDIGRFDQAIYNNDYVDGSCVMFNGSNHAEYGYKMLTHDGLFNFFAVPSKYRTAVSSVVRFHQLPKLTGDYSKNFKSANELCTSLLTGNETLNEQEKIIVSALLQMVKDMDMIDIFYQSSTGEIPVVKPHLYFTLKAGDSLEKFSNKYGLSKEEIKIYNSLDSDDISDRKALLIPTENMDKKLLMVPKDIQDKFFNNEQMDLKGLMDRDDFTFITVMWWRLSQFLLSINLVSDLEVLEESQILDEVYETYPEEYRFLVSDAFEYAKKVLLEDPIKKNEGNIYVSR